MFTNYCRYGGAKNIVGAIIKYSVILLYEAGRQVVGNLYLLLYVGRKYPAVRTKARGDGGPGKNLKTEPQPP